MTSIYSVDESNVRDAAALLNNFLKGNRVYVQGHIIDGGLIGPAYAIVKSVVFYPNRIDISFNFIGLAGDIVYKIPVLDPNDKMNISIFAINDGSIMASSLVGILPKVSFCVFSL